MRFIKADVVVPSSKDCWLEQQQVSDISGLIQLYQRSQTQKEPFTLKQLEDSFPFFYKGFAALQSKEKMAQHLQASGLVVEENDPAIDLIVMNKEESDEMHTYPDALWFLICC